MLKLDSHRIVIRERGYLELLDLGLRVLRNQAGPLCLALLAGVGPLAVLNAWLLNGLAVVPAGAGPPWTFLVLMLAAVLWEAPLATAPVTICLGRTLFNQPLPARQIAWELVQSLPQLIYYQVLLRGLLLVTLAGPFVVNPYINEVILLERNPWQATGKKSISTGQRSAALHRDLGSRLFVRWGLHMVVGLVLVAAAWGTLAAALRLLLGGGDWTGPFYVCLYPAALWIAVTYFTVVRFLSYLDLRIRREGWEVELLMRAELDRWTKSPQAS